MRDRISYGLLYLILLIIPIMVMGANFKVDEGTLRFMSSVTIEGYQRDFFSFFRMFFLVGIGPLFLIFSLKRIRNKKYFILILIFFLSQILSYLMSPYKEISLWGISGRYEGSLSWWAYMLILLGSLFIDMDRKKSKKIIKVLFIGSIPVWIIGFFQFFGKNPLLSETGQKIITFLIEAPFREISGRFGMYRSYGTLGNPNYMGSYAVMLIFLSLYFIFRAKGRIQMVVGYILYGGILFNLLGSRSRAGMVGGVVAGLIGVWFLRRSIIMNIRKVMMIVFLTGIIWSGMNLITKNFISEQLDLSKGSSVQVIDIKEGKGYLDVIGKDKNLYIKNTEDSIEFFDSGWNSIVTYVRDGRLRLKEKGYEGYSFMRSNENPDLYLLLNEDGSRYEFITEGERFYTLDRNNRVVEIPDLERLKVLDGYERKGSSRGYIWTRTIPLIKKRPLLGWGADTYSLVFPQDDYFGKQRSFGTKNMLVDKPHNIYLQLVMSFGFLGLGAFIVLIGSYVFESIRIYSKSGFKDDLEYMGFFIFLGLLAYLVTGLFNDSVVCVAPFFWILLGMGININSLARKNRSTYSF